MCLNPSNPQGNPVGQGITMFSTVAEEEEPELYVHIWHSPTEVLGLTEYFNILLTFRNSSYRKHLFLMSYQTFFTTATRW